MNFEGLVTVEINSLSMFSQRTREVMLCHRLRVGISYFCQVKYHAFHLGHRVIYNTDNS